MQLLHVCFCISLSIYNGKTPPPPPPITDEWIKLRVIIITRAGRAPFPRACHHSLLDRAFPGLRCFVPFFFFISPSAQWSASLFVSVCFVNLLSADENASPTQPFLACLPGICGPGRPSVRSSASSLPPSTSSLPSAVPTLFSMFRCSAPLASCLPLTTHRHFIVFACVFARRPLVDIKTQNITLSDATQSVTCFLRSISVWNHFDWDDRIIRMITVIVFKS